MLGLRNKPRLLNQIFISAECNIFHTSIVYTKFVRLIASSFKAVVLRGGL